MTETILLRGGTETTDPRLDRVVQFDERSRLFNVTEVLKPTPIRSRTWRCPVWLDQGREGACVGFSWSHALATTKTRKRKVAAPFAQQWYKEAQKVDQWPGEDYEGTSVLAGAKVAQAKGFIESYRWAFGIDQVLEALSKQGPVVLGIPWMDSMFAPDPKTGLLDCTGNVSGGHAIMARGHIIKKRIPGVGVRHVVRLRNSWGKDWGMKGDAFILVEDLESLLKTRGEACVPLGNKLREVTFG